MFPCRTCQQEIVDHNCISLSKEFVQIRDKLGACVPELDLDLVVDAVMCPSCIDALHTAYDFRCRCLEAEQKIRMQIERTTNFSNEQIVFVEVNTEREVIKEGIQDVYEYQKVKNKSKTATTLIHSGCKPFKCNACSFSTARRGRLIIHMKNHTTDKPYQCMECSFCTVESARLVRHMQTHTNENSKKQLKCGHCDFKCTLTSVLKRHLKTHTGGKLFPCNFCEYQAVTASNLQLHLSIHTDRKGYNCSSCNISHTRTTDAVEDKTSFQCACKDIENACTFESPLNFDSQMDINQLNIIKKEDIEVVEHFLIDN